MTYQLIHGDCLEILPTLAAGSVDAVITDPPYGTENLGGGYGRRQKWGGVAGRTISGDVDLSVLIGAAPFLFSLSRNNTWHGVFCAARKIPDVLDILESVGFSYFGEIIWNKKQAGLGYTIRYQHETVLIFQKGNPSKPDDAILSVITCHTNSHDIELHPHAKPVRVMERLVSWLCPRDGVVLDFTQGIGNTGVACIQTGRNFIGIEKERKYFEIAERRISQSQPPLFVEAQQQPEQGRMEMK